MKQTRIAWLLAVLIFPLGVLGQSTNHAAPQTQPLQPPRPRVVELKATDGIVL